MSVLTAALETMSVLTAALETTSVLTAASTRRCARTARAIGLITVSDAILTGRQSGQKLQCLYGNPMANNFFQNRILRNW